MFNTVEEYREYLNGLSHEELLGQAFLEEWADEEIECRVDGFRAELEDMDYEELFGTDLEQLVEDAIEKRIEDFRGGRPVTRNQVRQVLRELNLSGEIYRGYAIIGLQRNEWRISQVPCQRFDSRQDARDWVNERTREPEGYRHELAEDKFLEELRAMT